MHADRIKSRTEKKDVYVRSAEIDARRAVGMDPTPITTMDRAGDLSVAVIGDHTHGDFLRTEPREWCHVPTNKQ